MSFFEISHTDEMSHFSSVRRNFGESDSTLTNRISQFPETTVKIPILAIQNAQYNPMDTIPQTDSIHQIESLPSFDTLICDIESKNRSTSRNSLCRNRESNIFNLYETGNPNYFTDRVSLPSTSQIFVQNRESHEVKLCAMKFNEGKNTSKNMQVTDFSYGIADRVPYASSCIQTQQRNFGSGIINSTTEPRAWEYACPVTYSSETYNACNISTSTAAKESSVDFKEPSPDKPLSGNSSVLKQNLDTPVGKQKKKYINAVNVRSNSFGKIILNSMNVIMIRRDHMRAIFMTEHSLKLPTYANTFAPILAKTHMHVCIAIDALLLIQI
ncbi:hypothetical protein CDAR_455441 [Caerostris darwini]|uniref:Uncharacterized protein n=1 Tax=Caerostris darwini TaxID=1538125 RepID=A0AAV4TM00_9ARAC|nr:hypothetical protein CDAR_455441 [Caerostris darwini]